MDNQNNLLHSKLAHSILVGKFGFYLVGEVAHDPSQWKKIFLAVMRSGSELANQSSLVYQLGRFGHDWSEKLQKNAKAFASAFLGEIERCHKEAPEGMFSLQKLLTYLWLLIEQRVQKGEGKVLYLELPDHSIVWFVPGRDEPKVVPARIVLAAKLKRHYGVSTLEQRSTPPAWKPAWMK